RLSSILQYAEEGPWGICLDLQNQMPQSLLEIKYLLRFLSKKKGFFFSRIIIEQAAQALKLGKANQLFAMGLNQVRIDRQRVFMMASPCLAKENVSLKIEPGSYLLGGWKLDISEEIYCPSHQPSSWKEGWKGRLKSFLPVGNYSISFGNRLDKSALNMAAIKKHWNQAKVPAFLYTFFPLIWRE